MGLAADRSSARRRRSLLSLAAGLGCLALPAWSQSTVPGAEVISIDAAETTVVEVDGGEPLPTKPLRINTGLVTIESDQQQADQQTGGHHGTRERPDRLSRRTRGRHRSPGPVLQQ